MGRKRAGGAELLPQSVRRNNAKNERKTMEAMAENLWTSVESGKERRLRLAAERLYGLSAVAERTPAQQETAERSAKSDTEANNAPKQQKETGAPAKPEKTMTEVSTKEKLAETPVEKDKKAGKVTGKQKTKDVTKVVPQNETVVDLASNQLTTTEAQRTSDKAADGLAMRQRAAEVLTAPSTDPSTLIQQKIAEPVPVADREAEAVQIEGKVLQAPATKEPAAEETAAEEAAVPDEVSRTEAAVPTEGAEDPEQGEVASMSTWEVVDAPTEFDRGADVEPFPASEAKEAVHVLAVDMDKITSKSEDIVTPPVAETAEIGVSGREADLPTVSQSDVMTEQVTSADVSSTQKSAETVTAGEQDSEEAGSKNDSKKKKKKKKGKHQPEASTPPATTPMGLLNEPSAEPEQSQQGKTGKKQKRNKDKQKESKGESAKGADAEGKGEDKASVACEVTTGAHSSHLETSEDTAAEKSRQETDITESATTEIVDEAWTTVETKKTKRRRKRSERKSESEGKDQIDDHRDEKAPEAKLEPILTSKDASPMEAIQATEDDTATGKQTDETPITTGTTLDDFERLVSSIGNLKEKVREASAAKVEKSIFMNIESRSDEVEQAQEEPKDAEFESQEQTNRSTGTRPATASQGPEDAMEDTDEPVKERDASPDAFDLLMSTGDELEAGFKDAFGEEDQSESEPGNEGMEEQVQVMADSKNMDIEDKEHPTVTTQETSITKPESTEKEVTQDAFDLLMSAGDDLEEGFKDSFGAEEQVPKALEQGKTNESTEETPTQLGPMTDVLSLEAKDALKWAEKEAKDTDAAPDAFDLLMSADDDLEAGFKDAFGEEDQSKAMLENNDAKRQVQTPVHSNIAVSSAQHDAVNPQSDLKEASQTENVAQTLDAFDILTSADDGLQEGFHESFISEEEVTKDTSLVVTDNTKPKDDLESSGKEIHEVKHDAVNPQSDLKEASQTENVAQTLDAFDILTSADDGLQEGFKESFISEEEVTKDTSLVVTDDTKPKDDLESSGKEKHEVKIDDDQRAAPLHNTAEADKAKTVTTQAKNVDQTVEEEGALKQNTVSDGEVPALPITTPEWFDRTLYDTAEAKYHEHLSLNKCGNGNDERSVVAETEIEESVIQEPKPEASTPESAKVTGVVLESSLNQAPVLHENVWYDKVMHDNAETRYYENLSRSNTSGHSQGDSLLSDTVATVSASPSATAEVDSLALALKSGEAGELSLGGSPATKTPQKSIDASVENNWYDKVAHDEAETHYYERLSRSQRAKPSEKSSQESFARASKSGNSTPAVLSSEQTWFDKPFHDSAETVRHVRQASNESDNGSKSFPLYEGRCDHFKQEDQQTPEEKAEPCGVVDSHDSWIESKLYKVTSESDKSVLAKEQIKAVSAEQTIHAATSTPKKETFSVDTSSGQLNDVQTQQSRPTALTAVKTEGSTANTGELPHSPTSDGSRSRRSTFNSAVSPPSPQVEMDDVYFEDVVLAGRQSDVTMAALRGFTASPLSEGLAPGEQLDSLRTEPDLELSEPGTADTLDDGPFSYEDIGDDGTATPVGNTSASTSMQSLKPDFRIASESSETESKGDALSSTSDDLVREVNLEVKIPAAELRRDVPSPSLDGGVTKFEMETSITAPVIPSDLPPVSLGADITERLTSTDNKLPAMDLEMKDIAVPNIEVAIPPVQLTAEIVQEPQANDAAKPAELTSPFVSSTLEKSDVQTTTSSQANEACQESKAAPISQQGITNDEVVGKESSTNGMKESSTIAKDPELLSKEINERLGLNEDGTVPFKEADETIQFTEQGTPRSPVATKRCSRKKKMRSGGRKTSSESIENQSERDQRTTSVQDEANKTQTGFLATDVTKTEQSISAEPKDVASPAPIQFPSKDTEAAGKSETPLAPAESEPKPDNEITADAKQKASVVSAEAQPASVEKDVTSKQEAPVCATEPETNRCEEETESKVKDPASPTEQQSQPTKSESSTQVKLESSIVSSESTSKSEHKPEPQQEPADAREGTTQSYEPREPQLKSAEEPEIFVNAKQERESADKSDAPASSLKAGQKPACTRPPVTASITSTFSNEPKLLDQKPASKMPATSRPILPDRTLFLPDDEGRTYASLMQQGADMLPARPVFTAHACHVCKRLHTKQHRLKSCGSCRLVAYCSAEHQRAHWPLHRALCKVITRRVRHLGTDHLYREALNVSSAEQWKKIRFKHMAVCEEMLSRPMEAYEKEMFLYPRACDTCHETNPEKLHTCANCHSVSFCSEEHLRKNHSKYCKDLRTLLDIHSYQNARGVCEPPLPETVLKEYETLPPHIRELLVVSLLGPHRAMALGPVPLAVLSDYASYPLTLLYALQNIPTQPEAHISQLSELTVHVVGAEHATDCHPLSRWGAFLLHLLPRLRRLHVVFVGLELEVAGGRPGITQRDFTSAACRAAGRQLTCELQPSTAYHTYCRSPQFRPPHVIAAFNAGLHRFAGHERRDTWRETIPHLVRDGVPLILTGYTLLECPQDVARIQEEQKVDVLLPPMKNPYRSTRPQQNFLNEHEAPVVFKNQYVACLTAATKSRK